MDTVQQIRKQFAILYKNGIFVPDKTGQNVIEILGAQFLANNETIFGAPNHNYITRETSWYLSESLNVNDMASPVPKIWRDIASPSGEINSNYGYLIFSEFNGYQAQNCVAELTKNPWSRRAVMIYTRPTMWTEYNRHGMSDFICTNTVQYFIRQNFLADPNVLRLFAKVDMRSNDAWSGYRNDYAWQMFVFDWVYSRLRQTYPHLQRAAIIWNCGSLHLYERNFDLVAHFIDTGEYIPKSEDLMVTRQRLVKEGVIRES